MYLLVLISSLPPRRYSVLAIGVGVYSLAFIIGLRELAPRLPGFLIAVVVSAFVVALLKLPVDTVGSRFPDMPAGLPMPCFPAISFAKIPAVLPSAFTIAFLAGIEALHSAVVADGMAEPRNRAPQGLCETGRGSRRERGGAEG